jgi:uncharacterized damage-inducible protein DinB
MSLNDSILPEFDQEMATTRKMLERYPEARAAWQPHAKSMTLGRLAAHLAEIPAWVAGIINKESFDIAPPDRAPYKPPTIGSRQELLKLFDENVRQAHQALAACTDADYMKPWSLKSGGKVIFTMPRAGVARTLLLSHVIHHRGQYTVYLRLNDVAVPSAYGPTADESGM